MNALTFNNITLNTVSQSDNQIWLTSADLAKALDYKSSDSVTRIFNRNKEEFASSMSQVIANPQAVNLTVRIFSLRGCHLLAIFARTDVAKDFRQWVLDILDREVGAPVQVSQLSTVADRKYLKDAVNFYCAKTGSIQSEIWKMVHQRFNVENVGQITIDQVPLAVEYVHGFILQAKQVKEVEANHDNEFWRYVGIIKHQELTQALRHAKDVMHNLHKAIGSAQGHAGLIYDAFGEQISQSLLGKEGHHDAYIRAQAFVENQDKLMERLR